MKQNFSEKILLIEDDVLYASVLTSLIKPHFGSPITIANGKDALEYLLHTELMPMMILMDYRLPHVSGLEIIEKLEETKKDYPIIFLTAESGTTIVVEAMKKGAIDFLEKGQFRLQDFHLIIKKNIQIFQDRIEKKRLQLELEEHKDHLEEIVKERTEELEMHKDLLEDLVKLRTSELEKTLSDLKTTQAQLLQSEKMASLGTLLAGVAHEINNPINYINSSVIGLQNIFGDVLNYIKIANLKNNAELPQIDLEKSAERIEKMLTNINTGISKTVNIVNSLRTFSRSSDGIMRETNIHEMIDGTLTILYTHYKDKIKIIKHYGDIPLISCILDKINQVLMNILANAMQAIDESGTIVVATENYGRERIKISIQDSGSGIPENIQSKIFDPFFTTKEPGKGTGLGLSIAYDIIKQHNGEITVQSKVGEGTVFTIILPIKGE